MINIYLFSVLCYTFLFLVTHWTSHCSAPVWYIDI